VVGPADAVAADHHVTLELQAQVAAPSVVSAIGQLDVLAARIKSEYDLAVRLEPAPYETARWVEGAEAEVKRFIDAKRVTLAEDHDNAPVFLARNKWELDTTMREWPTLSFKTTREQS